MSADSRLLQSILSKDPDAARLALADGASPDVRDAYGQTALCMACLQRVPQVALLLIESGADVSLRGSLTPPLTAASSQGLVEVVAALLARGAPLAPDARILATINKHDAVVQLLDAETERRVREPPPAPAPAPALLEAAAQGQLEQVRAALAAGADLEAVTSEGHTALHWAAVKGHADVVWALLDAGAVLDKPDREGRTALAFAARSGARALVVGLLERGASPQGAALRMAAQNGHAEIVGMLLERGAPVEDADGTRKTPLILAARGGHEAVVQRLLAAGARLDPAESEVGANALHAATLGTSLPVLERLLDAGAAVDAASEDGLTALSFASAGGDLEMVRLLLARGAGVDVASAAGETPLLRAAAQGHLEVVRALLDAGAAVDHRQKDHLTPLMAAAHGKHTEVAKLLLERGADPELYSLALRKAQDYARFSGAEDIEAMLAPPPQPVERVTRKEATEEEQKEANARLVAACWRDDVPAATQALRDGASPDGHGHDIPLLLAASAGATDIIRLLLLNGADVEGKDATGLTALAKACGGCQVPMARALLEAGAQVTRDVIFAASVRADPRIEALLKAAVSP